MIEKMWKREVEFTERLCRKEEENSLVQRQSFKEFFLMTVDRDDKLMKQRMDCEISIREQDTKLQTEREIRIESRILKDREECFKREQKEKDLLEFLLQRDDTNYRTSTDRLFEVMKQHNNERKEKENRDEVHLLFLFFFFHFFILFIYFSSSSTFIIIIIIIIIIINYYYYNCLY
jgi:ATP-dependent Zn protease